MPLNKKQRDLVAKVTKALDYSYDQAREFCGELLEDVNDHSLAFAMRSLAMDEFHLARAFIDLEEAVQQAGELTPELKVKRDELLDAFNSIR